MIPTSRFRHLHEVKLTTRSLRWPEVDETAKRLMRLVKKRGWTTLKLNLARVEYVTGAGLGKLVSLDRRMRKEGGQLSLSGLKPQVVAILEATGLLELGWSKQ